MSSTGYRKIQSIREEPFQEIKGYLESLTLAIEGLTERYLLMHDATVDIQASIEKLQRDILKVKEIVESNPSTSTSIEEESFIESLERI